VVFSLNCYKLYLCLPKKKKKISYGGTIAMVRDLTYCFPLTLKDIYEVCSPETVDVLTFLHSNRCCRSVHSFLFFDNNFGVGKQ
jgi:hypothetical protein